MSGCNSEDGIPRCQKIHMEYKNEFSHLRETIHELKQGEQITMESFTRCMEFIYKEGWGDCFNWQGELPGETTLDEFFELLPIQRYGR